MPRHLRHHVRGGWYHITTRGMGRRVIFPDNRSREHFLELLWHNVKDRHAGPVFQARYKSIPVDGQQGSWALMCSIYLHLNPVRISSLGLGKSGRACEKAGLMPEGPDPEVIARRLSKLRSYPWSSYPAYAGYATAPVWLTREKLWQRVARVREDAARAYRKQIEVYLKQGMKEAGAAHLTQALVIGSAAFIENMRRQLANLTGEGTNAHELGAEAGMNLHAVSKATTRIHQRLQTDKSLRRTANRVRRLLEHKETKT